ncbi:MAG: hypothetical protein QGG58_10620 [Chloroflexota bacterium]|nr:hypothetical protein [Chloroflexota bacterium]
MSAERAGIRRSIAGGTLRRHHSLPYPGEIVVAEGDAIEPGATWARCTPSGRASARVLAEMTRLPPARIGEALLSPEGKLAPAGELLARGRGGLRRSRDWVAEWPGVMGHVSKISGLAFFIEAVDPVPLYARLGGTVVEVVADSHIVIQGQAVAVAGAFGGGGTGFGNITVVDDDPGAAVGLPGDNPALLVFTGPLRFEWLTAYQRERVAGVVAPTVAAAEIESRTGLPPTRAALAEILDDLPVLLTEGIGSAPMPPALQRRFRRHAGHPGCLRGSARAGEAEVLLPAGDEPADDGEASDRLRIGNGRHLGAEVVPLAGGPRAHRTDAGQLTRQIEVRSDAHGRLYVPLWNLESLGPDPAPDDAPEEAAEADETG